MSFMHYLNPRRFVGSSRRRRKAAGVGARAIRRPLLESLESRHLLAISVLSDSNGILVEDGTACGASPSHDTITLALGATTVDIGWSSVVDGVTTTGSQSVSFASIPKRIRVDGGFGNDKIIVNEASGRTFESAGFVIGHPDLTTPHTTGVLLFGQHGQDTLQADVTGVLMVGDGAVEGGEGEIVQCGTDYFNYEDILYGGDGDDAMYGHVGVDHLYGGRGDDHLFGGSGDDHLEGGEGDDKLSSGEPSYGGTSDLLLGGAGNDILRGSSNSTGDPPVYPNDKLYGGDGDDVLYGGNGSDLLDGEHGCDTLYDNTYANGQVVIDTFPDVIFGGSGQDTLNGNLFVGTGEYPAGEFADYKADRFFGGSGRDIVNAAISVLNGFVTFSQTTDLDTLESCNLVADRTDTNTDGDCTGSEECQTGNRNQHPNRARDEDCDCDTGTSYSTYSDSAGVQAGTQQGDADVSPGSPTAANNLPKQSTKERPHPIISVETDIVGALIDEDTFIKPKRVMATLYLYKQDDLPGDPSIEIGPKWFKFGQNDEDGEIGKMIEFTFQADADDLPTGYYRHEVYVEFHGTQQQGMIAKKKLFGDSVIVNRMSSEFGAGMWLPELDRLYLDRWGVALVRGDNTAAWFEKQRTQPAGGQSYRYQGPETSYTKKPENYITPPGTFYPLERNSNGTFTLWLADGERHEFDALGRMIAAVDRFGNQTTYSYDVGSFLLKESLDPLQRKTQYAYVGTRLSTITDFALRVTTFEYATPQVFDRGSEPDLTIVDLARIIHPAPATGEPAPETKFYWSYATSGTMVLPAGMEMRQRIGASTNESDWLKTFVEFDTYGRFERLTRSYGKAWASSWSLTAQLVSSLSAPSGAGYASAGLWVESGSTKAYYTDEFGEDYEFKTDRYGLLIEKEDPLGGVTLYERDRYLDSFGNLHTSRGIHGLLTKLTLPDPDLANPNDGGEIITSFEYNATPNEKAVRSFLPKASKVTLPDGRIETRQYDLKFGLHTELIDEFGRDTDWTVNATTGFVTGEAHSISGAHKTFAYTPFSAGAQQLPGGQLTKVTDGLNRETEYTYYNWTEHQTGQGLTPKRWQFGLVKEIILPEVAGESANSVKQSFDYDTYGNLASITDELGRVTLLEYDKLDRLVRITSPSPGGSGGTLGQPVKEFKYDLLNRLIEIREKNSQQGQADYWNTTAYEYLQDGREVKITEPPRQAGGANVISRVFLDPVGKVSSTQDPLNRTTLYAYDELQRLKEVQQPDPGVGRPTTSYTYDRVNRLVKATAPATPSDTAPTRDAASTTINAVQGALRTVVDLGASFADSEDPDSALRYELLSNDNPGIFDSVNVPLDGTAKMVIEHGYQQFGTATITVRATDTRGQSISKTFVINVQAPVSTGEIQLNGGQAADDKFPAVSPLPDGGFLTVWVNNSNIYVRRFDARGASVTGVITVTTTAQSESGPAVAALRDGNGQYNGFVVTWEGSETVQRVYAQRFDTNNAAVGGVITVDDNASLADRMVVPIGLTQGGFVVVWRRSDGGSNPGNQVVFQRFSGTGQKLTADGLSVGVQEVVVNVTQSGHQGWPQITALPDGGWTVSWDGAGVIDPYGTVDSAGIFLRRYDRNGEPTTGEMPVNAIIGGTKTASEIANDGTFVVTWRADVGSDTSQVFVRKFGADGTPVSPELIASTTSTGVQNIPDVAILPDGGFVVVWYGNGGGGISADTVGIFMRRYDRDAKPTDPSEVLVNSTIPGTQAFPNVLQLTDGRLLVAWQSNHTGSAGYDVYGRFVTSDKPFAGHGALSVQSIYPGQTVLGQVDRVQINFSEPINSTGLVSKITVRDHAGAIISGTNVQQISQTGWSVTFPSKTTPGVYSVAVSTAVTTPGGAPMSEAFTGTFTIANGWSGTAGVRPETRYEYDSRGRQTKIIDAASQQTSFQYLSHLENASVPIGEERIVQTAPLSRVTTQFFDALGRLRRIEDPAIPKPDGTPGTTTPVTQYAFDAVSNLVLLTDARNATTKLEYDQRDQLIKQYEADPLTGVAFVSISVHGPQTDFGYDKAGQLTSVTAPSRQSPGETIGAKRPVTAYRYDGLGRLRALFEPNAGTGIAVNGSDVPQGPATYFTYDMVGNLLEKKEPDLGASWGTPITTYEYDRHFNLTKLTQPDPDGTGGGFPLARPITSYGYDDLDRQTSMTDPLARVTTYDYDALDRLNLVTGHDPDNSGPDPQPTTSFKYDAVGNLIAVTDPLNRVSLTRYDLMYRPVNSVDAIGGASAANYDAAGRLGTTTDELGRITTYAYDGMDRLTSVLLPDPGTGAPEHKYLFDELGNLKRYTDPRQYVTDYSSDFLQRLTLVQQPDAGAGRPQTSYQYDEAGQLLEVTDPLSRHTAYGYDYLGQQTHIFQADPVSGSAVNRGTAPWTAIGPKTVRVFDALGRVTQVTAPDPDTGATYVSPVTNYDFDALGRLTRVLEPDPLIAGQSRPQTTYSYDPAGQLDLVTNSVSIVTDYDYDGLGRRIQETVGGTQVTKYGYDLAGNLTRIVAPDPDGSGNLGSPVSTTTYDRLNRVVSQQDPREGLTRFAYDAVGNLSSLADPLDNVTSYTYDVLDRQTRETSPLSAVRKFEYDKNNNLVRQVDRRGWVRQFTYDALNRNTEEKWFWSVADANAGAPVVRDMDFTFDKANQLTTVVDPAATYGYVYDKLGRVTQNTATLAAVSQSFTLDMTYDLVGRRESLKAKIGATKDLQNDYVYDGLSRLKELKQQDQAGGNVVADKRVDFRYDSLGRFSTVTRYSTLTPTTEVVTSTYGYNDSLKRQTDLTHKHGTTTINDFDWAYDKLDRATSFTSTTDGQSTYQYDATGQLTFANHAAITDEKYVNDLGGNRRQSGASAPTEWTTGPNNQLFNDGSFQYYYDSEGNRSGKLAASGTTGYEYDHRNRLVRVTNYNALETPTKIVEYSYDAFDRRTRRAVDATADGVFETVETFVYDGDDVLLDILDADGAGAGAPTVSKRYLHGPATDQILAEESGAGVVRWYLGDNLGTTRDLVNNSGALVSGGHYQYDAYGNVKTGNTALTRYLYTAREFDRDTSLQYNRARWYDAATGRWITEDPIKFRAGDTNLSRVVGNSVTNATDPSGLAPPEWKAVVNSDGSIRAVNGAGVAIQGDLAAATPVQPHADNPNNPLVAADRAHELRRRLLEEVARLGRMAGDDLTSDDDIIEQVEAIEELHNEYKFQVSFASDAWIHVNNNDLFGVSYCTEEMGDTMGNLPWYVHGLNVDVQIEVSQMQINAAGIRDSLAGMSHRATMVEDALKRAERDINVATLALGAGSILTNGVRIAIAQKSMRAGAKYVATQTAVYGAAMGAGYLGSEAAARAGATENQIRIGFAVFQFAVAMRMYYAQPSLVATNSPCESTASAELPILNPHFTLDPTRVIGSQNAYSVLFRTTLPPTAYPGQPRGFHFQNANRHLIEAMDADPRFAQQIESMIPGIREQLVKPRSFSRESPSDWTWHHHADTGVMELVPRVQHEAAGPIQQLLHPNGEGGMNIWGK
jgi:RHS repeat-associated protein